MISPHLQDDTNKATQPLCKDIIFAPPVRAMGSQFPMHNVFVLTKLTSSPSSFEGRTKRCVNERRDFLKDWNIWKIFASRNKYNVHIWWKHTWDQLDNVDFTFLSQFRCRWKYSYVWHTYLVSICNLKAEVGVPIALYATRLYL